MINSYKKGITALELLITLAILGILFALTIPQFSRMRESQLLKGATSDILSALDRARSNTQASVNSSEYGVHFQSDQVIIFKGVVFSAIAADNEPIILTEPVSITDVTLDGISGASGDMYFNRLYGVPSAVGTITISTPLTSKIITISVTGGASVN